MGLSVWTFRPNIKYDGILRIFEGIKHASNVDLQLRVLLLNLKMIGISGSSFHKLLPFMKI